MTRGTTPPAFVEPQLATLVREAPEGDAWLHEIKYDGYRILARLAGGRARLLSRRGKDWTASFPPVARAVEALPVGSALLDGEVVVVLPDGRTSFQELQNALDPAGARGGHLAYYVFDLLHLDGRDLTELPLEQRKQELERLLARAPKGSPMRYSDHVRGHGPAFFAQACAKHLEGIVSKRRDAKYCAGRRGPEWVKTKCTKRQELVVGGFTDPEGSRAGIGALLVGVYDGDALRFAGKCGTGFTTKSARELRAKLDAIETKACPFAPAPERAIANRAHWVTPTLVAEVEFTEWTSDGRLRHPSFKGLRADKRAREVVRETPAEPEERAPAKRAVRSKPAAAASKHADRPVVAGQAISNPQRALWPDGSVTKLELAEYLAAVSDRMLPHVVGRPLTLVRCPKGIAGGCFYMKHSGVWAPPALDRIDIREQKKTGEYLLVRDAASLVALAQMDVLEIHTWNSTRDHVEEPNRIVLDLDPGPDVAWPAVVAAAQRLRELLADVGLTAFLKTTGGKGLHLVVPLVPDVDWDGCLAASRAIAEAIVREAPSRYTTSMPKQGREKKILVDYLRNNRGSTSVAALSPRARPGAPVSMPIAWDELGPKLRPDQFTLRNALERLNRQRKDPWAGYAKAARSLRAHAAGRPQR